MKDGENIKRIPRKFANPAVFVGKTMNIDLLPKKALYFKAGLLMLAISVQILMIIFFPLSIMNSIIWITTALITLLSVSLIRTKVGSYATGISAGILISYTTLELTSRFWLIVITVFAIIYLGRTLLKYDRARNEYPLALETNLTFCQILFLRPFHQEYANWARNLVLPILQSYGRVTHVTDKSFKDTPYSSLLSTDYRKALGGTADTKDMSKAEKEMFELVNSVTGGDPLYGQKFSNEEWQSRVEEMLKHSDIVVIDVSKIGKGLEWEIQTAYEILPVHRVILITISYKRFKAEMDTVLKAIGSSGIPPQRITLMEYNPRHPRAFIKRLHESMKQIIKESLPRYLQKLDEDTKNQNKKSLVLTLQAVGDVYFGLENFTLAKKYYSETKRLVDEHQFREFETFLLSRMSSLAVAMGDKKTESRYLTEMLENATRRN